MNTYEANRSAFQKLIMNKYKLSSREFEVFELIAQSNKQTAIMEKLFLSLSTIKTHRRKMYKKIQIESNANNRKKVIASLLFAKEYEEFLNKVSNNIFKLYPHHDLLPNETTAKYKTKRVK